MQVYLYVLAVPAVFVGFHVANVRRARLLLKNPGDLGSPSEVRPEREREGSGCNMCLCVWFVNQQLGVACVDEL